MVVGQDPDVGLAHADAVGGDGGGVEDTRVAYILDRGAVVVAPHVVALGLALGYVDMDAEAALAGHIGDHAQVVGAAAVGGVRVETEGQAVAVRGIGHLLERLGEAVVRPVVGVAHEPAADHGTHAAVAHGAAGLVDVHLLVVEAGGAGADHLGLAEQRRPVAVLGLEPVLDGLHGVEEPVGEAEVVGDVAHHGHVGVRVRVDEAGDGEPVRAVDHRVGDEARRRLVERRDLLALDIDVVPLDGVGVARGDDRQNAFDQNTHGCSRHGARRRRCFRFVQCNTAEK